MTKPAMVYVSESALPSARANGVQIVQMCAAFSRQTRLCRLVYPRIEAGPAPVPSLSLYYGETTGFVETPVALARVRWRLPRLVRAVRRACRESKPDLLYGRSPAAVLFTPNNARKGLEAHMVPARRLSLAGLLWELVNLHPAIRVVAISAALRDRLIERYPRLHSRCLVEPSCGSLQDVRETEPTHAAWASLARRVIYCGSISRSKGLGVVVDAARALPFHHVTIVGGTPGEVQREVGGELPKNLHCLGQLSRAEIPPILRDHGIALLPNQRVMVPYGGGGDIAAYNSPLKLFEYLANGNVVVASDMPNLREVLAADEALWAAPDQVHQWTSSILRCADHAFALDLIRRGRTLIKTRYNWDARAARILEWLTA